MPQSELELHVSANDLRILAGGRVVLRHSPKVPMLSIGFGNPTVRASHGNYRIRPGLDWRAALDRFTIVQIEAQRARIDFTGPDGAGVRLTVALSEGDPHALTCELASRSAREYNRLWLNLPAGRREPTFGCGEQFSRFNLRGSRVPIWTSEQGVGRGFNLTTIAANLHDGAGGHWHTTYFPQPSYVTLEGRFVHLLSDAYSRFDFRGARDRLEVWQPEFRFVLGAKPTLCDAVSAVSDLVGRQPRLPNWTHTGMWLGLQGGSDVIREKVSRAREANLPLSGVWVQDWVGRRVTAFGSQLFWDWRYDPGLYPDFPALTSELRSHGIRFLGYLNPFLAIEGELYKEASRKGYCVKNRDGSDYLVIVTTFPAALVDLSNPEAREWLKEIIKKNVLGAGLSGWMADYGEYLPTDAVLAGADAPRFHNRYPAEWARLNYEAISEAGALDETAIFVRAGYTGTSACAHSVWAGDQMVDWSRPDGLPSVIPAALSSGMVGIGVSHSDLGGFTSLYGKRRTKELLMRWAEHAAFTPIMRSHESNRPGENWQWDSDEETIAHVARMARLYVALEPYRRAVLEEYYANGVPAMRPTVLHYPLRNASDLKPNRYLFGRDLLVQPVIRRRSHRATVYLPEDDWVHLWSGSRYGGGRVTVAAPVAEPPVFYRSSSEHTELFRAVGAERP